MRPGASGPGGVGCCGGGRRVVGILNTGAQVVGPGGRHGLGRALAYVCGDSETRMTQRR